jgi:uncharacterized repeat protein (TIGR01451 family)
LDATLTGGFRFVVPVQITAIDNNRQIAPFTPVTIHGQGFLAPVAVYLAGIPATVISVSATELLVLPGPITCPDAPPPGAVVVTNIDSGDTATGPDLTFTYLCPPTPTPTPTLIPPTATPTPTPTATPTRTPLPPDVELTKSGSPPNPVTPGSTLTFTLTVTNKGSVPVASVVVSDPLPGGTTFLTCTPSQGTCNSPNVGTNGTVTANLGSIPAPGVALITITVTVPVSAAGTTFTNTAVVSSFPQDPISSHSIATYTVTVSP